MTGSDVLVGVSVSVQEAAPVFVEDPKPKKAAVVLDVARPLTKREVKVVLEQAGEACGVSPANITLTTTEGIALHAPPQDISESDAAEGARARRLFPLKHANAKELADGLAEMGLSEVDLAADEASNTLAVSAPVKRMDGIEKLIGMMDTGQRVRSNEVTVFRVDPAERERAAISGLSSEYASERDEQITVDFSEVAERIVAGRGLVDEPTGRVFAAGSTDDVETLIAEVNELLGQLQDEDWWLRKLAVQELASLAEGIASPEFQKVGGDFDLLPRVIDALKDEDARGRAAAAEALGTMGDARAVKYLVAALKEEDAGVREAAAEALARFDDPDVMRYLRYAAQDEYEVLRLGAITALGRIGNKEAVELLLGQFRQAGPEALRRAAVAALAQVPTDVVIEPLTAALRDADEKVVGGAVDALGMVGEEHARRALIVFLDTHSPSEYASWKAIKALAAFAGDDTTQTLVRALRHPSYRVRSEAAQVLERRKYVPETAADQAGFYVTLGNWDVAATLGEAAVPPLEAALEADDREVRNSAARVLGAIGDRAAVKSLCMLLQDESVKVRVAAVEALGHISDPAALEPLIVTLRDSNYEVRMGVARALGRIGHPDAIEPLCAALKDLNGYVRDEAGDVLKGHG
ncbi:MAG TPA: hypothetical protein HPP83_10650 [Candidatus Hydrogenedentes bacterium]|nr:hypothetical protein [Candidatus Hydrogenedentota bacterium]